MRIKHLQSGSSSRPPRRHHDIITCDETVYARILAVSTYSRSRFRRRQSTARCRPIVPATCVSHWRPLPEKSTRERGGAVQYTAVGSLYSTCSGHWLPPRIVCLVHCAQRPTGPRVAQHGAGKGLVRAVHLTRTAKRGRRAFETQHAHPGLGSAYTPAPYRRTLRLAECLPPRRPFRHAGSQPRGAKRQNSRAVLPTFLQRRRRLC